MAYLVVTVASGRIAEEEVFISDTTLGVSCIESSKSGIAVPVGVLCNVHCLRPSATLCTATKSSDTAGSPELLHKKT
jgi:hypothetical protein